MTKTKVELTENYFEGLDDSRLDELSHRLLEYPVYGDLKAKNMLKMTTNAFIDYILSGLIEMKSKNREVVIESPEFIGSLIKMGFFRLAEYVRMLTKKRKSIIK